MTQWTGHGPTCPCAACGAQYRGRPDHSRTVWLAITAAFFLFLAIVAGVFWQAFAQAAAECGSSLVATLDQNCGYVQTIHTLSGWAALAFTGGGVYYIWKATHQT